MTDQLSAPHVFTAYSRPLRRLGFRGGQVAIRVEDGQLGFTGEGARPFVLPVAAITRLRIGSEQLKYGRFYQAVLWRGDTGARLTLMPLRDQQRAYSEAARALAARVLASGGRVERGIGMGSAMLPPLLFALLSAAAIAVAWFALGNEPWWGRLVVVTLPLLLLAVTLAIFLTRTRPRPIATLDEIERELPDPRRTA